MMTTFRTTRLAAVAAMLLSAAALGAQEWGVDSTTNLGFSLDSRGHFNLGERIDPWFKVPVSDSGSKFEGSAHIGFDWTTASALGNLAEASTFRLLGDLDLLKLSLIAKQPTKDLSSFSFAFGRYLVAEPTGNILSHKADGVSLGFSYPGADLNIDVAYTGLVLKNSSSIYMTNADIENDADENSALGSPRLLYKIQLDLPKLGNQAMSLWVIAQQDITNPEKLIPEWSTASGGKAGGAINSEYVGLRFNGPIVDTLFYNAWFSYELGNTLSLVLDESTSIDTTDTVYQYKPISAAAFGGQLSLYLPKTLSSAFTFRFVGATGDADASAAVEGNTAGDATQFSGITPASFGTVFSPGLTNILFFELGGSVIPFEGLPVQTGLKAMTFIRPTTGPVLAQGLNPDSKELYLGTEFDIFAIYRILSDLGLSFNGGFFFPSYLESNPGSAFLKDSGGMQFALKLELVLNM